VVMPSRNTIKNYVPETFYHIYNRGVEKRCIFLDDQDYAVFLSYLKRHLTSSSDSDAQGKLYNYYDSVELLAYCLMPNHFHLLVYIGQDQRQITKIIQSVCTAYSMYFNKRYRRVGHLFQGRFKASEISNDAYVQHISRYIHLNPDNYEQWPWSSLPFYLSRQDASWVHPERILKMFDGDYESFLDDYVVLRDSLKADKYLADDRL